MRALIAFIFCIFPQIRPCCARLWLFILRWHFFPSAVTSSESFLCFADYVVMAALVHVAFSIQIVSKDFQTKFSKICTVCAICKECHCQRPRLRVSQTSILFFRSPALFLFLSALPSLLTLIPLLYRKRSLSENEISSLNESTLLGLKHLINLYDRRSNFFILSDSFLLFILLIYICLHLRTCMYLH